VEKPQRRCMDGRGVRVSKKVLQNGSIEAAKYMKRARSVAMQAK
jgi:hypothetical protein